MILPGGLDWRGAFALGAALAMSSTALVSKMLAERRELETEHGRRIFAVLLFQDIAVIPILALLPLLAAAQAHDTHDTSLIGDLPGWAQTIAVLAAVAVVVLAAGVSAAARVLAVLADAAVARRDVAALLAVLAEAYKGEERESFCPKKENQ